MKKFLSFCLSFLLAASLCPLSALGCYSEAAVEENRSIPDDL